MPAARKDVQKLLKSKPLARDLLIEHLHLIQDKFGHLSAAHLAALAEEMKLAQAEVYEVATFYHHLMWFGKVKIHHQKLQFVFVTRSAVKWLVRRKS